MKNLWKNIIFIYVQAASEIPGPTKDWQTPGDTKYDER